MEPPLSPEREGKEKRKRRNEKRKEKEKKRFKVLRERHTTGEMHFPLLAFTLSLLAEAALRSGSRSGGLKPARALALAPGRLGSLRKWSENGKPYSLN